MESAHAFVKAHLLGPQQTFTSVIQLISNAIKKQYHEITTKHAQQKITTLRYLGNFFRLCLGKITNYAIRQAYNSLEKAKSEVPLSRCNQQYVARLGIPCKHWLLSLFQSGELLSPDEFHAQWQMNAIPRPAVRSGTTDVNPLIEQLTNWLRLMNPAQQAIQLAAINQIIEGSGTVVDIMMPTEPQKTQGQPKGAPNKPRTTKRDPSAFEHVEKKRKAEEKQATVAKKQKFKDLRAAEKAMQKAEQKADNDEAEKKTVATAPKRRLLPARSTRGKAGLKEVDLPQKKDEPAPKEDLSQKNASLQPEPPQDDEPEEQNSRIDQLPEIIKSSVQRVVSPASNGHCGFRAIAWCLGHGQGDYMQIRQELINEIQNRSHWYLIQGSFHRIDEVLKRIKVPSPAPCGPEKWISMPCMGDVMANAFETPVFFFSPIWSQTHFPYFCPPNNNNPIFFALLGNHYLCLELTDPHLFPAPRLMKNWRNAATPEALKWEEKYAECFQLTVGRKILVEKPGNY
ncbi:uncharacterized protein PGTG_22516 [Puccinia graminis f. sp. tritici CRL 75-36-700-3]|uniref:OTU domain-containing protein n=1 Tax=Puccinia graminis f. sp. tritici (strain CRL 75-36-700-3 / race SCCL) TaxID=418459 RepID=H6QUV9_PUCGT|nr:uncharacterized protein PGTG_22516 [Puccinia graminis f. sp. tritici CRL 75-36-700-3]EHS64867.1 hypothetical protein PGTG_22516 [Puccinia graminis f. sp. tritici CRL 75-36-700-3]